MILPRWLGGELEYLLGEWDLDGLSEAVFAYHLKDHTSRCVKRLEERADSALHQAGFIPSKKTLSMWKVSV